MHEHSEATWLQDKVVAGIGDGRTVLAISRELGVSKERVIAIARGEECRYKYQHLDDDLAERVVHLVTSEEMPVRVAAATAGVSKSTVGRCVQRHRRRLLADAGNFRPISVPPYRCPRHGKVTISPCPACEAMAAAGLL